MDTREIAQAFSTPASVDLTSVVGILMDVIPGGTHLLRREQEGVVDVTEELGSNVPSGGAAAGIPAATYAHFVVCTENLAKIRAIKGTILKLAEVIEESEVLYEHERETDISIIADAIRSTARRRDKSVLATYEKTLKYNSQIAQKGYKTRRKNAALRNGNGDVNAENATGPISPTNLNGATPSPA